jgi:signal transduction histidine kinase
MLKGICRAVRGFVCLPWTRTFAVLILLCVACQCALAADQRRRIYFLEPLSPTQPAAVLLIDAFRKRLSEKTSESFDIFIDYMDMLRIPGQAHIDRTVEFLSGKYADAPPDVLIVLGRAAIPFMGRYRDRLAPNSPVIIASVPLKEVAASTLPVGFFFVPTEYNFGKTLRLAEQLQPGARNLVVIGGISEYDRQWLDDARRELQPFSDRFSIRYISDLPFAEVLKQVSLLPEDTIVMMSFVLVDGDGKARSAPATAEEVAKASSVPVYAPINGVLGRGIVGGTMDSWEQQGVAAADLVMQILSGKNLDELPRQVLPAQTAQIDERAFKRWNLSKSNLPPDADIRFREFDVWEQYRWQIIAVLAVLLGQAGIITWLQLERSRRRQAQEQLRQRLLEVTHLNRTALAGALSASVAHELNQPLGAIQSYADAASLYLKADPPNIDRVEEILDNIRRDDQRAADIISHFRGLLKKRDDSELLEFDLNEAIRRALSIVEPEATKRGVRLTTIQSASSLPVRGDPIHVEQVILNLAINGMDAMQSCGPGEGRISIESTLADGESVEVSIADSGIGIPSDKILAIFDAFYTTKRQGTGLGLSIARTIVETYGGKIWAENRMGGGAVFRFTLPLSRAMAT